MLWNGSDTFPGLMSYKATKPGSLCPLCYPIVSFAFRDVNYGYFGCFVLIALLCVLCISYSGFVGTCQVIAKKAASVYRASGFPLRICQSDLSIAVQFTTKWGLVEMVHKVL